MKSSVMNTRKTIN